MNTDDTIDWNAIVEMYSQSICDRIFGRLGDQETAIDVTQDAFVTAYKQRHLLTAETVEGFLFRAADHYCDRQRRI